MGKDNHSKISMTSEELRELLDDVAEKAAERTLEKVGLSDKYAGEDIRNLRELIKAINSAKKTAWQTAVRMLTALILGAFMYGAFSKIKFFGS